MVVTWTFIDSAAAAEAFAAALEQRRPGPAHYTSISGAIDYGATLFEDNGFEGTRQVIDVSGDRSEEHTSELQSLMRISYAVFCLKKKKTSTTNTIPHNRN